MIRHPPACVKGFPPFLWGRLPLLPGNSPAGRVPLSRHDLRHPGRCVYICSDNDHRPTGLRNMPTPLHTHSWYSLLEGVSGPEALVARAEAGGYTALALTDTNNLYGAVGFVELAYRQGLRPLLG